MSDVEVRRLAVSEEYKLAAIHSLTHSMQGCDERWAARRETGLDDRRLAIALAYEFGIMVGRGHPHGTDDITGHGGTGYMLEIGRDGDGNRIPEGAEPEARPKVVITRWPDGNRIREDATISGRELLTLARRVLDIHAPGQPVQGALL